MAKKLFLIIALFRLWTGGSSVSALTCLECNHKLPEDHCGGGILTGRYVDCTGSCVKEKAFFLSWPLITSSRDLGGRGDHDFDSLERRNCHKEEKTHYKTYQNS